MTCAPWTYENLLGLDLGFRDKARELVQLRIPSYSTQHCLALFGGAPHEYSSRCLRDDENKLVGIMAFSVGKLGTVEIVAFVAVKDGCGIGRFMMESFVAEMEKRDKSAILTYVEPAALPFFSRLGFSKQVPARSLYERVISKYVKANLMYRDLLRPCLTSSRRSLAVGDRLLVLVDGTFGPRQALIKQVRESDGMILIHYFFWSPRHDEWIYPHSPRICWDLELPPDPPKRKGENRVTTSEAKGIWESDVAKERKRELVESARIWPKGIKKNGPVQVRIEGDWVNAKVLEKNDHFCYCEFEDKGLKWLQDFPRDSVRLPDSDKSVIETLLAKKQIPKKPLKTESKTADACTPKKRKKKSLAVSVEVSPPKVSKIVSLDGELISDRVARKRKRDMEELVLSGSPATSVGSIRLPETCDSPEMVSEYTCSICDSNNSLVLHCKQCGVNAHAHCYMYDPSLIIVPIDWLCDTCKECLLRGSLKFNPSCVVCGKTRRDTLGVMTQTMDYKAIHVKCAHAVNLDFVPAERRFFAYRHPSPKSSVHPVSDSLR